MAISRLQFVRESGTAGTRPSITIRIREVVSWIGCFVSLVPLLLIRYIENVGTPSEPIIAILIFMAPWGVLFLFQPNRAVIDILQNWPLMLLPALAFLSTSWSDYPSWTLKASLEYSATIVIGIMAGQYIRPRTFLAALFSALLFTLSLSLLLGVREGDLTVLLASVFGSKNNGAFCISVLLLSGVAILLDRSQPPIMRLSALISLPVVAFALYMAKSFGAIVASGDAIIVMLMLLLISRLRSLDRITVLVIGTMIAVACGLLAAFYIEDLGAILNLVGKDETVTGRTVLWQLAWYSIAQRPFAGVGYQAFWQEGNWGAERMWALFGILSKTGFHFHDAYLQVAVDLGLIGLGAFLVPVIGTIRRAMTTFRSAPTTAQIFAIGTSLFLLIRTPVEIDFYGQFGLGTILVCVIWVWLEDAHRHRYTSLARPAGPLSQISERKKTSWPGPGRDRR